MSADTNKRGQEQITSLFSGKKEKWLPLYRRMVARFTRIGGLELSLAKASIALSPSGAKTPVIGIIRITNDGLKVGLALRAEALKSTRLKPTRTKSRKFSHEVLIADPAEIDDEFLAWIKAANRRAHTSKRRST